MLTILIVVLLILLLSGGAYGWRNNYYWGPEARPTWGIGSIPALVLIVLLVLWLFGMIGPGVSGLRIP
jgi:hypothetical protein